MVPRVARRKRSAKRRVLGNNAPFSDRRINTTAPPRELKKIEKLRAQELGEARAIPSAMLPTAAWRAGAVMVSHEFLPVAEVRGDFLEVPGCFPTSSYETRTLRGQSGE